MVSRLNGNVWRTWKKKCTANKVNRCDPQNWRFTSSIIFVSHFNFYSALKYCVFVILLLSLSPSLFVFDKSSCNLSFYSFVNQCKHLLWLLFTIQRTQSWLLCLWVFNLMRWFDVHAFALTSLSMGLYLIIQLNSLERESYTMPFFFFLFFFFSGGLYSAVVCD